MPKSGKNSNPGTISWLVGTIRPLLRDGGEGVRVVTRKNSYEGPTDEPDRNACNKI